VEGGEGRGGKRGGGARHGGGANLRVCDSSVRTCSRSFSWTGSETNDPKSEVDDVREVVARGFHFFGRLRAEEVGFRVSFRGPGRQNRGPPPRRTTQTWATRITYHRTRTCCPSVYMFGSAVGFRRIAGSTKSSRMAGLGELIGGWLIRAERGAGGRGAGRATYRREGLAQSAELHQAELSGGWGFLWFAYKFSFPAS